MTEKAMDILVAALRAEVAGTEAQPIDDFLRAAERVFEQGELAGFGRRALEMLLELRLAKLQARRAGLLRSIGKDSIKRVH